MQITWDFILNREIISADYSWISRKNRPLVQILEELFKYKLIKVSQMLNILIN